MIWVMFADILFSKMRRNSPLSDSDRGEFSPHFGSSIFWEDSRVASGGAPAPEIALAPAPARPRASPRRRTQAPDTHTARSVTARTLARSLARSCNRPTAAAHTALVCSRPLAESPRPRLRSRPRPLARPPTCPFGNSAGTMLEIYATAQAQRPRFGNSVRIGFPF